MTKIIKIIIVLIVLTSGYIIYEKGFSECGDWYVKCQKRSEVTTTTSTASPMPFSLTDSAFAAVTTDPAGTVIKRGDINQDGYEDAIVQKMHCGASCSISLDVVLNNKNTEAQLAVEDAFQPGYNPSGATKSELIGTTIHDGIISLTGYGIDCGTNTSPDTICTEEEWKMVRTIQFRLASTNGASKYYLERI